MLAHRAYHWALPGERMPYFDTVDDVTGALAGAGTSPTGSWPRRYTCRPSWTSRCWSRAGRSRQDRAGQGHRRGDRAAAAAAAVLRGPGRHQGPVRVGLRQAAAVHPDPAGEDRPAARRHPRPAHRDRADRAAGERLLLRALPRPAPAARSHPLARSRGPADRRGRPRGRGPGGGLPRNARRVSGIGAGDRHVPGQPPAVRHPHLEQHPRPVCRAQAPLPAPVSGLPERRARARDPAEQENRACPTPPPSTSSRSSAGCAG